MRVDCSNVLAPEVVGKRLGYRAGADCVWVLENRGTVVPDKGILEGGNVEKES